MATEDEGRIRVIRVPEGEAPQWVRRAWVGTVLPCDPVAGWPPCPLRGVLSGKPLPPQLVFAVPHQRALRILLDFKQQDAYRYWRLLGYPQPDGYFAFGINEVEFLGEEKEREKFIHVTE